MSPNELKERANAVLAGNSRSYVEDARAFASAIVKLLVDYEQIANQLSVVQTRCSELREDRRVLKQLVEKIAGADPDARDELIAEALVAVGGMQ